MRCFRRHGRADSDPLRAAGTVSAVRIAAGVAVLVVLVLVIVQLALPRLAERRVRDELRDRGEVTSVRVRAFPGREAPVGPRGPDHDPDALRPPGHGRPGARAGGGRGVRRLDATVDEMSIGPLRVRDVELRKRGDRLEGAASVTREDLSAALPVAVGLQPVSAEDGSLVLEASVGPLRARARLSAVDGALRIAPDGVLGGFASLTVFDDPRIDVTGVGARPRADGFTLTAEGRLVA